MAEGVEKHGEVEIKFSRTELDPELERDEAELAGENERNQRTAEWLGVVEASDTMHCTRELSQAICQAGQNWVARESDIWIPR